MKRAFRVTAIILGVLLLLMLLVPIFFRDRIVSIARTQINRNINAKAYFSDASLSFFSSFPNLSLRLDSLSISGVRGFEQDTLLSASDASVVLNLFSVISGKRMKVSSLTVRNPRVFATINKQGQPNWDIMKTDSTVADTSTSSSFNLELKKYSIDNASIYYNDSTSGTKATLLQVDHSGSGDFTQDRFKLDTRTIARQITYWQGGIPWLSDANVTADAILDIDNKQSKYAFSTNDIKVNELPLAADGFYQIINDSTADMDIRFKSTSSNFKNLLSLVPVVYSKDFGSLDVRGTAAFDGTVKGRMQGDRLPAYSVNAEIKDGYFKYKDLPAPVSNIQLKLKVVNPDGINDHLSVDIPSAHLEMNQQPVDFRFLLRNPETSRYVDALVKGSIQLENVRDFVKLDAGTQLRGRVDANVEARGSLRNANAANAGKFYAAGTMGMNNFFYSDRDYPTGVTVNRLQASFNPEQAVLEEATGRYMSSSFDANGQIFNLFQYLFDNEALSAVFNVNTDKVLVSEFMSDSTSATTGAASSAFIVPANLAVQVNAGAKSVVYENLAISDLRGSIRLANETLQFNDVEGKALDGTLKINGSYSTRESKTKPAIALQYSVKDLDVQKTFMTFNTVQKLMPIGKWLGGKLNSELKMSGSLTKDLSPDFNSLTGNGNLFLIEGLLEKFKPLEQLADRIHVDELKQISLREVRQYFEFTNGKVLVKPFNLSYKDIRMEIGGAHGFDQSLDYVINLVIPRARFGTAGNQVVDQLVGEALKRGIPVKPSETVNLKVNLRGFINNPQFAIDLKEAASSLKEDISKQAREFATARIDSAKQVVKDTVQALKKEVIRDVSEELKKQIFNKKDSTSPDSSKKVSPDERLKQAGKGIFDKLNPLKKPKPADTLKKTTPKSGG